MISIIIFLAVIGLVLWLFPGIDARLKQLIYVVAAVAVILWVLSVTGLWSGGARLFPR